MGNFSYINAYTDFLWAVLHWNASADISMLLDDFKAYVVECSPKIDIFSVADLANIGVDLTFLGPTSRLTRLEVGGVDPTQLATSEPMGPASIEEGITTVEGSGLEMATTEAGGNKAIVDGNTEVGDGRENLLAN